MSLVCSCVTQFNIGAMVYKEEEGMGVRSGKLPAPRKIELSFSSTLKDIRTNARKGDVLPKIETTITLLVFSRQQWAGDRHIQ